MSNTIQNAVLSNWRGKCSNTGWISGNAVCCPHNGESADKRGRGGVILNADGGVSYACFNCNFKTGYVPGYDLSYKFKKLLRWMGVDDLLIFKLSIDATRERERQELLGLVKQEVKKEEVKTNFKKFSLPPESLDFMAWIEWHTLGDTQYSSGLVKAVEYISRRKIVMPKYKFYWSPSISHKMDHRVIVPFTWKNEVIGYTARAFTDGITPKYYTQVDNGYVFNFDAQQPNWKFVLVAEGIFDALSVDGVAVMRSEITNQQADLIESLDREIIVVPDWNKSGQHLIDAALRNEWSVSFPVWAETCTDINEAVVKYGKLYGIKTIFDGVEHRRLKIELKRRKYS